MKKIVFLSSFFLSFAIMASAVTASAETYSMELRFASFVRYKGDLSHTTWNPRNKSVVYKFFATSGQYGIPVRIDDEGNFFGGNSNKGAYSYSAEVSNKISGKLSPDKKTIIELSADYTFKIDIREEKWSLTLKDIPLHKSSDTSDRRVLEYYIEGSDVNCKLIPLNKHVVGISNEHRFPDGGSVVLDELLLDKQICDLDAIAKPGGFYNLANNYQVPSIRVVLEIRKDIKKPQQKKTSDNKKKKR